MGKFLCPFCFKLHDKKELVYRCMEPRQADKPRCKYGCIYLDKQTRISFNDYNKVCSKCENHVSAFCPVTGKQLPLEAMGKSMSIVLLGGRNSGKSNYIAVLVQEIKRTIASRFSCSLNACDDTTGQRYNDLFYKYIYIDHTTLPSTDGGRQDPLLYTLSLVKNHKTTSKSLLLPLYDTAGENMLTQDSLLKNVNVKAANSYILLVDPFEIEPIREILTDNEVSSGIDNESAAKAEETISRIISLYKQKGQKRIKAPIAIVLTKLDLLLQYTNIIPENSVLRKPSRSVDNGCYIESEFAEINTAARELFMQSPTYANLFNTIESSFTNVCYFAISSFGENPGKDGSLSKHFKPMRVLDPLIWQLANFNFINTRKK